jgi:hypothetical protein
MRSEYPQVHSLAFALLSIGTTAERAAEIEGDLIEQSLVFGKRWMWKQVLTVALFLVARAISRHLVPISLLSVPALAAIYMSVGFSEWVYGGPIGSFLADELALSEIAAKIAVLCLVVMPSSYLVGAMLVRAAPTLGAKAAVAVVLVFVLFAAMMQLRVQNPSIFVVSLLRIGLVIGLVAAPLLWGSISSHRRGLRRAK